MSHTPRSAPDEPYIVFADQRRLRWWWRAATRRTAYVLLGAITLGAAGIIAQRVDTTALKSAATPYESLLVSLPADTTIRTTAAPVTRVTALRTQTPTRPALPAAKQTAAPSVSAPPQQALRTPPPRTQLPPRTSPPPTSRVAASPPPASPPPAPRPQASSALVTNVAPPITKNSALTTSAAPGWLVVSSKPWGNVFVDGRAVGTTPLASVWLAPGAHRIEIRRDGFKPFLASVTIDSNREFRLTRVVLDPGTQ